MLLDEVFIRELLAVDRLATSALRREGQLSGHPCRIAAVQVLTLPRVKSPPWSMNWGMTRWNLEPL